MEFLAKISDQSVQEWIEQLQDDCIILHRDTKETVELNINQAADFFEYLLEHSSEPQYKLMRALGFYPEVNPDRQKEILIKIQELCDECRKYIKEIKKQTFKDKLIRATAEWLSKEGDSLKEIVDNLIDVGLVDDLNRYKQENIVHEWINSI